MPPARKTRSGNQLLRRLLFALFFLLWTGIVASGAWFFLRSFPPSAPASAPPSPQPSLLDQTRQVLASPELKNAGRIVSVLNSASPREPSALVWETSASENLLLAEKVLQEQWSRRGTKFSIEYPEHSQRREKIRLLAYQGKEPVLLVSLRLHSSPKKAAPAPVKTKPPTATAKPRPPTAPAKAKGKIAIIIDDVGNDLSALRTLLAIPVPLTFSVLPYARHTAEANSLLRAAGAEVMLHLPMEPLNYPVKNPGEGALLLGMTPEEIENRISQALAAVPQAKGINNHMGSAFTADRESMRIVLLVLKKRGLFYVDSRTIHDTTAFDLARELHVKTAQRNLFLDDTVEVEAIRAQVSQLAELALKMDFVIAIGHPHPETVQVLSEVLPEMREQGYRFVSVSEVVE